MEDATTPALLHGHLDRGLEILQTLRDCKVAPDLDTVIAETIAFGLLVLDHDEDTAHARTVLGYAGSHLTRRILDDEAYGPVATVGDLVLSACRWFGYAAVDLLNTDRARIVTIGAAIDQAVGHARAALTAPAEVVA